MNKDNNNTVYDAVCILLLYYIYMSMLYLYIYNLTILCCIYNTTVLYIDRVLYSRGIAYAMRITINRVVMGYKG